MERLPWASGKERTTKSFQWFLSGWARRLSWRETARQFGTSRDTVFRSVKMTVCWGLRHRDIEGIEAIGVDEVAYRKGHRYLTLVHQIDGGSRRLLWIGKDRTKRTLRRFFRRCGKRRTGLLKYICSAMWSPYLSVIAKQANDALYLLDRFHIVQLFDKAIDKVRAEEARRLKAMGYEILKGARWLLLKRRRNLIRKEVLRLKDILAYNLKTVKCHLMKQDFQRIRGYKARWRVCCFFQDWLDSAKRSRIEPMKKLAGTLDRHAELIFSWFEARGEISAGAVEGMNLKVESTARRSFGFQGKNTLKCAPYHNLGKFSEPDIAHKFCG